MENYLKIQSARIASGDKRNKLPGGLYIDFTSKENLVKGDYLSMLNDDEEHYFKVTHISVDGRDLDITARETGYYANRIDQKSDFDLRTIIGNELKKVIDKDKIERIYEMSCWL